MSATATNLRISGYTIAQLQQSGYTDEQILTAGYSANELRLASYTATQLKNAGYSNKDIIQGKYNNFQLKKAGIKTAYELRKMGYTAYQIMNEGYSGQIFKTLKFTPTELLDPEVTPSQMRSYGYSIADMKRAGIRVSQLLESGFELKRIITAGFGLSEILIGTVSVEDIKKIKVPTVKTLYSATELLNAGLDITYLRRVGFTPDELKQLGITATQLRRGGYDPIQVHNAGYSLNEMKDGGYFAYEVINVGGYTFTDLVNAGYSIDELKTAGQLTFNNIVILGYTSISGLVNFMTTNNSTAYNNGGIIIAGGVGIAKDVYLNELHSKLQINLDVSGQMVHNGTNFKLIHLIENGIIRFTVKENGQISLIATNNGSLDIEFPNKTIQVNYDKVNIPCTTVATSFTTGALTSVGGISSQNNIYGTNYIACDPSGIEVIRVSGTVPPSSSSSTNGIVTSSKTGLTTVSNDSLNIGKNARYFGARTLAEPSAVLQISGSTGTAFSFQKQQANSQTMTTDLTISSSGIVNVFNDTQSSTTSSGSLQTNGGLAIEKNLNIAGNITVWDMLNSGTVQQSGTSIGFSSGDSSTPTPSATTSLFPTSSVSETVISVKAGVNWIQRTSPQNCLWLGTCWSPERSLFVSVAYSGTKRVMTSPDGIQWTLRDAADNSVLYNSVCWSPALGIFCSVASSGNGRVMTSTTGLTWIKQSSTEINSGSWQDVCWSPQLGIFCAVGNNASVITSNNGTTWSLTSSGVSSSDWRSVCWSPELSKFCAVAYTGTNRVMTSSDGVTWTSINVNVDNQFFSICWSPELRLFCAVAVAGTGTRVMTSPDGVTWTARTPTSLSYQWLAVEWSPEMRLFCAVSATNNIMTSPDGINWTNITSIAGSDTWRSIAWSPELKMFVAVSQSSATVMTSVPTYSTTTVDNSVITTTNNADLHTYIYNEAYYFSPKTILAQTFSIHLHMTTVNMSVGYPYFTAIYLQKDQVVKGVIHICTTTGGKSNYYCGAIYGKGYQPMRLAYTGDTPLSLIQGFNYIPFQTSWTVPTTDIYYIGWLMRGTFGSTIAIYPNNYMEYSTGAPPSNTLCKTFHYYGSGSTTLLPAQIISAPGLTTFNSLVYAGVYG